MARQVHTPNKVAALLWILLASCSGPSGSERLPAFNATTVAIQWRAGLATANNQPFTGMVYRLAENTNDTIEVVGFLNGKEHGEWKRFYDGGKLAERRFFFDGKKTGDYVGWWPNGQKRLFYHFDDGEYNGVCREWSPTGMLLKEMTYKNGYEEGRQQQFYDNGKIKANYIITNGRRYGLLGTKNCVNATDSLFKY